MDADVQGPPEEAGAPAWMATFGDMMSLLLCFFVLLLSFAQMDVVKFKQMAGSMANALGVESPQIGEHDGRTTELIQIDEVDTNQQEHENRDDIPPPSDQPTTLRGSGDDLDHDLIASVNHFIEKRGLAQEMDSVPGDRGLTIRVKGALMFKPGSNGLRIEANPVLDQISELAALFPYKIAIEGHTDDSPINTERFPSNWELSTARAVAGVRYLIDEGDVEPERVSATGFAHTRPIVPNMDDGTRAQNRRLEFVFYREDDNATYDDELADKLIELD